MNEKYNETDPSADNHEIELLVDGELNDQRRRELLAEFDVKPGGWRRCALAFLEDQCWQQTCGSINEKTKRQPTAPPSSPVQKPSDKSQYRRSPSAVAKAAGALMVIAGSVLLALGLYSTFWNAGQQGHLGMPGGSNQASIAGGPYTAAPTNPRDRALIHDKKVYLPDKYKIVTITDKRPDGTKRSIQLPAVVQNNINEARLREIPSAIPPELVQAFQEAGHKVHQSRRLVPFQMQDGRRLVVPVDQLDVQHASTPYYQ